MTDLIDRQAAIKEAHKIVIDGDAYEVVQIETLMGLPSADVATVRHGTWIEDRYNNLDYVCSECGEPCAGMVMGKPRDKYCKWCGARMDGEA